MLFMVMIPVTAWITRTPNDKKNPQVTNRKITIDGYFKTISAAAASVIWIVI